MGGSEAPPPTCGPFAIFFPTPKRWDPPNGWSYVANLTTCGSLPFFSPALKCWEPPPRLQGLCSHLAHLWALSDFIPRFEALGSPQMAGVM